ncbi:MAG: Cupin domain [Rhodobacteraceae bacterium HLUCCA12]|nr:MAG: Cupin domain [Rhodobacteraceae bacterium HLUCCA12]
MPETQELSLPVVDLASKNDEFRKAALWTGDQTLRVLMAIPEGGEIGAGGHEGHDQLQYLVAGSGLTKNGETECDIADGDVSVVPSGDFDNFRNTEPGMMKLFTTYSPPDHEPCTENATTAEATRRIKQ